MMRNLPNACYLKTLLKLSIPPLQNHLIPHCIEQQQFEFEILIWSVLYILF